MDSGVFSSTRDPIFTKSRHQRRTADVQKNSVLSPTCRPLPHNVGGKFKSRSTEDFLSKKPACLQGQAGSIEDVRHCKFVRRTGACWPMLWSHLARDFSRETGREKPCFDHRLFGSRLYGNKNPSKSVYKLLKNAERGPNPGSMG